jgi:hypothetical protein
MVGKKDNGRKRKRPMEDSKTKNTASNKKRMFSPTQIGSGVRDEQLIARVMLSMAKTNPKRDELAGNFYKYTLKAGESFTRNHQVVRDPKKHFKCVFYLMGLCGNAKSYRGPNGAAYHARRHVANDHTMGSKLTVQPSGCRKYAVHYNDQGAEETVVFSSKKTAGQVQSPVTVSAVDEENLCYTLQFGESFEAGNFGVTDGERHCCVLKRLGQCTSRDFKGLSGIVTHSVRDHGREKEYERKAAEIKPPAADSKASAFFRVGSLYFSPQGGVSTVSFARIPRQFRK